MGRGQKHAGNEKTNDMLDCCSLGMPELCHSQVTDSRSQRRDRPNLVARHLSCLDAGTSVVETEATRPDEEINRRFHPTGPSVTQWIAQRYRDQMGQRGLRRLPPGA